MIIIIYNVVLIKEGILLLNCNFHQDNPLFSDMHLVSSFLTAIQIFSSEVTRSSINTINFDKYTFHFYLDSILLTVIISDNDHDSKEIGCKLHKISSIFLEHYSLNKFSGEISQFEPFSERIIKMKIEKKNCGGNLTSCKKCPYEGENNNIIINEFKENDKIIISLLNGLLKNLLNEIPDFIAVFIIDLEGIIIAQQSINQITIEAIFKKIEPIIKKIKNSREPSFESGNLDTPEFRLFYVEIGGPMPTILIMAVDIYSDIDNYISYSYIVAEKISMILNNRSTSIFLPKLLEDGKIDFNLLKDPLSDEILINQIMIIGPEKCGKSSLIEMYSNGRFESSYKPTIGIAIVEKELLITRDNKIKVNLFDMGGLKSFAKVRKFFYKNSKPKVILILFDYTRIETLHKISEWIEEARHFSERNSIKYIVIGNKIDLIKNRDELRDKAKLLALQLNCSFFETSALTGEGIDELFTHVTLNC